MIRILLDGFLCRSVRHSHTTRKLSKSTEIKVLPLKRKTAIDEATICLLEQLSLVECANKVGIKTLEDAVEFAERIFHINTDHVKPMYTVLEDRFLSLRDDRVTDGYCQKDILKNATLTEEDYLVAPPGNIPLSREKSSSQTTLYKGI